MFLFGHVLIWKECSLAKCIPFLVTNWICLLSRVLYFFEKWLSSSLISSLIHKFLFQIETLVYLNFPNSELWLFISLHHFYLIFKNYMTTPVSEKPNFFHNLENVLVLLLKWWKKGVNETIKKQAEKWYKINFKLKKK